MLISKLLKSSCGFTVTELLIVTSLISSIPASSYIGGKNKALQTECLSNLQQISLAIEMFTQAEGVYPDARFYSEDPLKDSRSIVRILEPYGMKGKIFICPTAPPALAEKGLTYLWNDELNGKDPGQIINPAGTWMLVDITALDARVSSHMGGYNILYADGHVAWSSQPPPISRKE